MMRKKEILWVSSYVPYDTVGHAGGKIHNYYLKYLHNKGFNVRLLSICRENELTKIDLYAYGIQNDLIVLENRVYKKIFRYIGALNAEYNIFHKYAGILKGYCCRPLKKQLEHLKKEGYDPKVIIAEWTDIVVLIPYIKNIFPNSKIISIEEDVSFQSYYRKWQNAKNRLVKYIYKKKYNKLKKIELEALNLSDKVILNNIKDEKLLLDEHVTKERIFIWCPYFDNMSGIKRKPEYKQIIFYGAMGRKENYLSAIWFIKNVMPLLCDLDISFEIIGAAPPGFLKNYESEKIHVLGFVKDVSPYFQKGLCLAAPLVLGAGVKIKILEAMSSGLPVLTNQIGIEGILAVSGKDYFFCQTPHEYARIIKKLYDKTIDSKEISFQAQNFIKENYNLQKSADDFVKIVEDFCKNNIIM